MCGNRVEELESQVKELQASVEGLTDELVECKVRLAELEEVVDEEMGYAPELRSEEEREGSEDEPEMRVPEPGESQEAAEAPNTEAPDDEDNAEESESGSDIIVA